MNHYHISPIKGVLGDLEDSCLYVLCTSWEELYSIPEQENLLVLQFADTLEVDHPHVFTAEHALAIKNFVNASSERDIFICCDRGESRSAAIVAALLRGQGQSDEEIWTDPAYNPNKLVYARMLDVLL